METRSFSKTISKVNLVKEKTHDKGEISNLNEHLTKTISSECGFLFCWFSVVTKTFLNKCATMVTLDLEKLQTDRHRCQESHSYDWLLTENGRRIMRTTAIKKLIRKIVKGGQEKKFKA